MATLSARLLALEAGRQSMIDIHSCSDAERLERMNSEEGYSLELLPGGTLGEKVRAVFASHDGELQLSPEARHAARGWFRMLDEV